MYLWCLSRRGTYKHRAGCESLGYKPPSVLHFSRYLPLDCRFAVVSTDSFSYYIRNMATITWGREFAAVYDSTAAAMFQPEVVDPVVTTLADLAAGGTALEFAIGTGRVALPLSTRGVPVSGIELSPHMVEQLRTKPGSEQIPVTVGDMATTKLTTAGSFSVVYLVFNTIENLTTQEEQIAVFANAATHLAPGGFFVVEVRVPQLRRLPPAEIGRVFELSTNHVGIETFEDLVGQISWSHHWMQVDGQLVRHSAPYRYVWPSELDLMARLAGMQLRDRWSDWAGQPFSADSTNQVAVYHKCR